MTSVEPGVIDANVLVAESLSTSPRLHSLHFPRLSERTSMLTSLLAGGDFASEYLFPYPFTVRMQLAGTSVERLL